MKLDRTIEWKCLEVVARIVTTVAFDLKVDGLHHVQERCGAGC